MADIEFVTLAQAQPVFVTLPAEIDMANADRVGEQLAAASARGMTVVIADMTATTFCGSAGIGMLLRACRRAAALGIELRLLVTSPRVLTVMKIAGVDTVLPIYHSLEGALAAGALPATAMPDGTAAGARAGPADEAVRLLYHSHYTALVRTAVLLVGDVPTAEEVVQDSFIATYRAWWRLRDASKALPYLRSSVMNRARSVLRRRVVAGRPARAPGPDAASAEENALALLERSSVLAALDALSIRQRQVIVLRYYADLSEAQIAATLGIAPGSVKSHAARALSSLRAALG
jgi:RNA polymerase sigma-70 factor (sigma-E family)